MNIENVLTPDAALKSAALDVKNCQQAVENISERRAHQQAVVEDLSGQLKELIASGEWENAQSPENASKECTKLATHLEQEETLLGAMTTAYRCASRDLAVATRNLSVISKRIIKDAALKEEGNVKSALVEALQDFLTCEWAKGGIQSVGAAQYELEKLTQQDSLMQDVEKRMNSIHQSLYEQVAA